MKSSRKSLISGQADAKTAKRAHDDAKVQLAAAQTTAGQAPARRRRAPAAPRVSQYDAAVIDAAVASAFASPELAAQLAQDGVTVLAICEWIVGEHGVSEFRGSSMSGGPLITGVLKVLNNRPEYVFRWISGNALWRRVPVAGMDLEAPPPAAAGGGEDSSSSDDEIDLGPPRPSFFDPQMFAAAAQTLVAPVGPAPLVPVAPAPIAQAPPVAPPPVAPSPVAPVAQAPSPAVVAPTPPRAPPDVAWGFDTPVWSVEAKFTSNLKQHIQIGHNYEDRLTVLDRMGEVHGLVVVAETADEKFALVCATPKIASGIRSGKFWAAMQGEDCFFVTVKSDARRLYERRSRPHTRFPSRRRWRVPAQQAAGLPPRRRHALQVRRRGRADVAVALAGRGRRLGVRRRRHGLQHADRLGGRPPQGRREGLPHQVLRRRYRVEMQRLTPVRDT